MYRIPTPPPGPKPKDHVVVVTMGTSVRGVHGPFEQSAARRALRKIREDYPVEARCLVTRIRAA